MAARPAGNRRSFYDRFMADMCRLCVLVEPIPDHGSLGGEVSQYQVDFAETTPRKLRDLYRLGAEGMNVIVQGVQVKSLLKFC